jgi:hypothetical protein
LQVENQQLKVRENSLRKERESKMEFKESLEKSVEELSKKVSDGATQLGQLSKVMHAKKEELANARERETSSAARSEQLNEQVRLLKAQVVHNPEALFLVSSAARILMYFISPVVPIRAFKKRKKSSPLENKASKKQLKNREN